MKCHLNMYTLEMFPLSTVHNTVSIITLDTLMVGKNLCFEALD